MTYRRCKNPHPTPEGESPVTMEDVIEAAIYAFDWHRKKVMSWYMKENPRLKKARPSELVDRGQGKMVLEFLEQKYDERLHNARLLEKRNENK